MIFKTMNLDLLLKAGQDKLGHFIMFFLTIGFDLTYAQDLNLHPECLYLIQ